MEKKHYTKHNYLTSKQQLSLILQSISINEFLYLKRVINKEFLVLFKLFLMLTINIGVTQLVFSNNLLQQKASSPNFYLADGIKDGDKLAEVINAAKRPKTTFHLFSHGKPGALLLEGSWRKPKEIIAWLHRHIPLHQYEHLNIYGCNFAQGEKGQAAIEYLKSALGISVAASDDVTGIDGDWELEVGIPNSPIRIEDYHYNLQSGYNTGCGEFASGFGSTVDGTGRNRWTQNISGNTFEISWNTGSNRWEIIRGGSVRWYNTTATTPDPPCVGNGTWEIGSGPCALTSVQIDGNCSNDTPGGGGNGGTPCTAEAENTTSTSFIGVQCNSTVTSTLNVTDDMTITDLNVGLNITLDYRHHLTATLTSPAGTVVELTSLSNYSGSQSPSIDNFDLLLDQSSGNSINDNNSDDVNSPYYGDDRTAAPTGNLNSFNGENAMGTWTLTVCDANTSNGNDGNINRWKLFFEGTCANNSGTTFPPADYTIDSGGTVNTCSGTFADSGNTNGDYSDSESHTMTFCSDQNNHISFTFEHFNTEATNDVLSIYDGNSTGVTKIGDYSGSGPSNSPGVVTSSGTCLTFQFVSNGSTTSTGWIASISCTGQPSVSATAPSWTGYPTNIACGSTAQIGGKVYEDIDNDGTQDTREPGIFGVTVTLYDDNGQVGSPETTDANGDYTFSSLTASTVYRVEFTVPDNFTEGPYGSGSGTAVQFIESGRCDVNLGLADASHYCDSADPFFVIPCYANGDAQHSSNAGETGIARFRYSDSGDSPASTYTNYVTFGAIGTTWGVAWDGTSDRLYMSSVLKRHAGLGPNGIGAIYQHNDGDANTAASVFYDFGAAAGTVDDSNTRFPGSGSTSGEGPCGGCDNIDPTTFSQIGKVGFGDIDINPEGDKLYVTNLYDRKIYTIDIDNPTAGSATPLHGIPWLDNSVCSNGVARPWALEFRRGKLYVGVLCDASLSSCSVGSACSDLTAEIYSFDGTTWTNELSFAMDYYRKAYSKGSDYFVKWIDEWSTMEPYVGDKTDANFGQPIIMDLEFDDDNSLIIGIGDRSGLQLGYQAPNPTAGAGNTSERNMGFGDILRASYDNSTGNFTLENNGIAEILTTTNPTGNSGPGGKSFYWGDYWTGIGAKKYQAGLGSLMLLPNSGEVATPLGDALDYYSNGITWMKNTDGSDVKRLEVYQGSSNGNAGNFSKSTGVGDMILFCEDRPIEIGNIVWWDENLNGRQDPSEPGISGVTIELWTDPNGNTQGNNVVDGDEVKVASTTTDTYGRYIFSYDGNSNGLSAEDWSYTATNGVQPNTYYNIRIPNWATDAGIVAYRNTLGYASHIMSPTQNQTGTDGAGGTERDNNSFDNPGNAAIALQTGNFGDNNHNYDFAFGGVGGCDAPSVVPTANTLCDGETLNLMAAVSGGASPYSFNWSGPNSFTSTNQNPSITNADSSLYAGIYYLTVTDDLGCVDTTHIHVHINKVTISATATDATCGASDGTTDLTIGVGVTPFTIDWSNDGTGDNDDDEDLTGLAAGSYTVTVTDNDGCSASTSTSIGSSGSVTLSETHVDETCTAGNGSINLTITGTHTTIDWDNDGTGDNDDSANLSGLSAGTYSVTVNNAGNCPATLSVTLTDTSGPSVSTTQVNTTCGNSNGSVDLTVSGGTAPYSFQWDNDGTADSDDTEDVAGLVAGTYNVTVTDATGCTAITNVTITNTAGPTLSATPTNETCSNANGSIDLMVMDGTGPFTYAWNNGLTTEDISGLGSGTFMVTVTDANGCMQTTSATVSNTVGPTLSVTPTNSVDCNTDDGSIDLMVSGGTSPYTYDWDSDGYEMPDNDTEDLSSLAAGAYMVIVTDANGCTASISTSVENTNDPVLSTSVTAPTTCLETGNIDLTVTGGNSPFTYDWSNDGLGENDDMEDISGLAGGVYSVIVTGADGCAVQANASIQVIRDPVITETIVQPTCGNSDGSITLSISDPDGSGAYTYDWDIDGMGDNDDAQNQTGLTTGNYSVTVTNGISCTATATYSLAPTAAAPMLTLIQTNPTCGNANGSIDMTITDGASPYDIDWDNNGTGNTNDPEDLSSLSAGTYSLTVTDNGGCQTVGSAELVTSENPILNASISNPGCSATGGVIDLTVTGVAAFTYDWDNDGTGDNDDTEDLTGLTTGNTYNVTVTDGNGCTATAAYSITTIPTLAAAPTNPSTCGGSDGSIALTLTNVPDGTYTINYMDAVPNAQIFTNVMVSSGSATITGLSAGVYNDLTITVSGCTSTEDVNIVLTEPVSSNILGRDTATCQGTIVNLSTLINGTLVGNVGYGTSFGNYPDTITISVSPTISTTYFIRDSNETTMCVDTTAIVVTVLDCDWGDLPDTTAMTNATDYQTTSANNGPVHVINPAIILGSTIDGEVDGQSSSDALGDGVDEDGLLIFENLDLTPGGTFRLPLSYVNTTGNPAYIEAWIDWNNNGEFDSGEMVLDVTDPSSGLFDRLEVTIPTNAVTGEFLGLRIRISNQDNMTPYGLISEGEVEDYLIGIECATQICVPVKVTIRR